MLTVITMCLYCIYNAFKRDSSLQIEKQIFSILCEVLKSCRGFGFRDVCLLLTWLIKIICRPGGEHLHVGNYFSLNVHLFMEAPEGGRVVVRNGILFGVSCNVSRCTLPFCTVS